MSSAQILFKSVDESKIYDIDFTSKLADGDTLTGTPVVTPSPASLTVGSPSISGNKVQVRLSAGTNGQIYEITVSCGTTQGDTLTGVVKLQVQNSPWLEWMVRIVRNLIDDTSDEPTYTDGRLGELILVSAYNINAELDFAHDYTVDIDDLTISPDPTSDDPAFVTLVCLKAACMVDTATLRTRAKLAGISVKDSMGSISTLGGGVMDGMKMLIQLGPCKTLEEAKKQYMFGGNMTAGKGILSPFSSASISANAWYLGPSNNHIFY